MAALRGPKGDPSATSYLQCLARQLQPLFKVLQSSPTHVWRRAVHDCWNAQSQT